MGKASELSLLVDELRRCAEALTGISEGLADLFSNSEEKVLDKKNKRTTKTPAGNTLDKTPLTLEEVRAVLAEKSRAGFTAEVKAIITKHGADKLSAIKPEDYAAVLAEVEVLGNAE